MSETCPICGAAISEAKAGMLATLYTCPNGHEWRPSLIPSEDDDE